MSVDRPSRTHGPGDLEQTARRLGVAHRKVDPTRRRRGVLTSTSSSAPMTRTRETGVSEEVLPNKLRTPYDWEEDLRDRTLEVVAADGRFGLHVLVIERAMDLADRCRQIATDDEDVNIPQLPAMRTFTAFCAALKLALSGYGQNCALIMRDILETVFLLDLFCGNCDRLTRCRLAEDKEQRQAFSPIEVRKALDAGDGFHGEKRAAAYRMFSELAAHPRMKSHLMMRPRPNWDAVSGPFIEAGALRRWSRR